MSDDDTSIGPIDTTDEMRQMAALRDEGIKRFAEGTRLPITLFIQTQDETVEAYQRMVEQNPCLVGRHKPAYHVNGGIACAFCGRRF